MSERRSGGSFRFNLTTPTFFHSDFESIMRTSCAGFTVFLMKLVVPYLPPSSVESVDSFGGLREDETCCVILPPARSRNVPTFVRLIVFRNVVHATAFLRKMGVEARRRKFSPHVADTSLMEGVSVLNESVPPLYAAKSNALTSVNGEF